MDSLHRDSPTLQKKLRELLPDDNVVTPDVPVSPIEALQLLLSVAGEYKADDTIVVGTSMGAMSCFS